MFLKLAYSRIFASRANTSFKKMKIPRGNNQPIITWQKHAHQIMETNTSKPCVTSWCIETKNGKGVLETGRRLADHKDISVQGHI